MKHLLTGLLCILLLASFASVLAADEEKEVQENDKSFISFAAGINPFLLFGGNIHASVQLGLGDTFSIPVSYTGYSPSMLLKSIRLDSVSAGVRFYPGQEVLRGFYIGPFGIYQRFEGWKNTHDIYGVGLELGAMINIGSRMFLDMGSGFSRYPSGDTSIQTDAGGDSTKIPLVLPVFNLLLGVKF